MVSMSYEVENKILKPFDKSAICPSCGVYSEFNWKILGFIDNNKQINYSYETISLFGDYGVMMGVCNVCKEKETGGVIFIRFKHGTDFKMIYPFSKQAVKPSLAFENYSDSYTLFNEASLVLNDSPRAGMALARMCIESLANYLLDTYANNYNSLVSKIKALKDKGFLEDIAYNALENIRLIGNNAVHSVNEIDSNSSWVASDVIVVLEVINDIVNDIATKTSRIKRLESIVPKKQP